MYQLITDAPTISQSAFLLRQQVVEQFDSPSSIRIGFHAGTRCASAWYNTAANLFVNFQEPDNGHHWLGFGIGNPSVHFHRGLTLIIHIASEGNHIRTGAAFVTNQDGDIFLVHTGKIGGGRAGIGKRLFAAHVNREPIIISRDGNPFSAYMIAGIHASDLCNRLSDFVYEVQHIKSLVA